MKWGPVLYLFMSYWYLSNKQIFDNVVFPIKLETDILMSGHHIPFHSDDWNYDQSIPCLIMGFAIMFFIPLSAVFNAILNICVKGIFEVKLHIDEDLSNYFDALEPDDREWWVKEEEHVRNEYSFKVLIDESLQKIRTAKVAHNCIQGVHCYDILANP